MSGICYSNTNLTGSIYRVKDKYKTKGNKETIKCNGGELFLKFIENFTLTIWKYTSKEDLVEL